MTPGGGASELERFTKKVHQPLMEPASIARHTANGMLVFIREKTQGYKVLGDASKIGVEALHPRIGERLGVKPGNYLLLFRGKKTVAGNITLTFTIVQYFDGYNKGREPVLGKTFAFVSQDQS